MGRYRAVASENPKAVGRLDIDQVKAAEVAQRLTDLLVDREIITANLQREHLMQPSVWRSGPS